MAISGLTTQGPSIPIVDMGQIRVDNFGIDSEADSDDGEMTHVNPTAVEVYNAAMMINRFGLESDIEEETDAIPETENGTFSVLFVEIQQSQFNFWLCIDFFHI